MQARLIAIVSRQPDRAVALAEKALQLNPNYPYWYNQALRFVYFFGRQFDKSLKYAKLITDPFATDYAYLAAASAMMGDMAGAKVAASNVARLDPNWSVEKYTSDSGGYPDDAAVLFVAAAREAGATRACRQTSSRQCQISFISRHAMRRGLTKPPARLRPISSSEN
jgi:tetratricopeptide (TPR) repeat protein